MHFNRISGGLSKPCDLVLMSEEEPALIVNLGLLLPL